MTDKRAMLLLQLLREYADAYSVQDDHVREMTVGQLAQDLANSTEQALWPSNLEILGVTG